MSAAPATPATPAAPGAQRPGGRTARVREAVLRAAGDALAAGLLSRRVPAGAMGVP
jgi:hypothetical protein